jgi:hypothetical protein
MNNFIFSNNYEKGHNKKLNTNINIKNNKSNNKPKKNNINIETNLEEMFNKYIDFKKEQIIKNSYSPDNNNINYLLIFAAHCDSQIKLETISNNLKYLNHRSIYIVFINTINLPYNNEVKQICKKYDNVEYYEVENMPTYDFGKWIDVLEKFDYTKYEFTIFTNDSFVIHAPINHFFNLTYKYNVDFYGYNDSTQQNYHYQSYLFSLKQNIIPIFINNYYYKKDKIKNQEDVITEYELKMTNWFNNKNCFLSIGNVPSHKGLNIFFTNDKLYEYVKKLNLLPFTKIKRLTQLQSSSIS